MDPAVRKVFIVGDSLFAETVAQLMDRHPGVALAGMAVDMDAALARLPDCEPDLIIVVPSGGRGEFNLDPLLDQYPDLPIVRADLTANDLRIIRSQRLEARTADLITAIQSFPTRR